ncbi:MAG: hypothetical protein JRH17_17865, partial [Deltaproteobacteria bacterium]|nr:hypothetical protein [Deltaproteobacteria bacterium]
MSILVRLAAAAAVAVAAFAAITWWALEWDGVMVVASRAQDGTLRETHIWYAESGERL